MKYLIQMGHQQRFIRQVHPMPPVLLLWMMVLVDQTGSQRITLM
ncbi:MAG: hypothetical protein ACHP9Y_06040 [Gammaproteobacteria bacterium]